MRAFLIFLGLSASAIHALATTTLQARDIDGDGTIDAYYDTRSNLTWLADANKAVHLWPLGATTTFFGVDGWRLPTAENYASPSCSVPDGEGGFIGIKIGRPCTDAGFSSEISQVLGDASPDNPFNASAPYFYQLSTLYTGPEADHPVQMFWSLTYRGVIAEDVSTDYIREWFVHDGDVSPVPEPSTFLLTALGIGALAARRRYCIAP